MVTTVGDDPTWSVERAIKPSGSMRMILLGILLAFTSAVGYRETIHSFLLAPEASCVPRVGGKRGKTDRWEGIAHTVTCVGNRGGRAMGGPPSEGGERHPNRRLLCGQGSSASSGLTSLRGTSRRERSIPRGFEAPEGS